MTKIYYWNKQFPLEVKMNEIECSRLLLKIIRKKFSTNNVESAWESEIHNAFVEATANIEQFSPRESYLKAKLFLIENEYIVPMQNSFNNIPNIGVGPNFQNAL